MKFLTRVFEEQLHYICPVKIIEMSHDRIEYEILDIWYSIRKVYEKGDSGSAVINKIKDEKEILKLIFEEMKKWYMI